MLRQRAFFEGRPVAGGDGCKDLAWFHPDGRELADPDWFDAGLRTIGMYLDGRGLRHRGPRGESIIDQSYLIVLHSGDQPIPFTLPDAPWAASYTAVIDTTCPGGEPGEPGPVPAGGQLTVPARTVLVLRAARG